MGTDCGVPKDIKDHSCFTVASCDKSSSLRVSKLVLSCSLALICCMLSSCASHGRLAVDPDRNFSGLKTVLLDLPSGGSLDIFLVHGMRADGPPPSYPVEIAKIKDRLSLIEDRTDPPVELVPVAPTVIMDGVTVFDASNWNVVRPRVTIQRFHSMGSDKTVNFYRFEYWQPLAFIKCKFVVCGARQNESGFARQNKSGFVAGLSA